MAYHFFYIPLLFDCAFDMDHVSEIKYYYFNSLIAGPRYIRGCCLMLERRYDIRAGA